MSLDLVELRAGSAMARVAIGMGGRLAQLDLGGGPLLRGPDPELAWSAWGSYPLVPWSNRIPSGTLRLGDVHADLPVNWPDGSAIHGLGAAGPWGVVDHSDRFLDLVLDIDLEPWVLRCHQRFELRPDGLRHELGVRNRGLRPVPVGLGIHPWFRAGTVRVPAERAWPGEPLPTGPHEPVEGSGDLRTPSTPPRMDRCFTGLTERFVEAPGVRLGWEGPVTQVVVYTGEPGWVALEPVTMANDGFGLAERDVEGHGVVHLDADDELRVAYTYEPGPT